MSLTTRSALEKPGGSSLHAASRHLPSQNLRLHHEPEACIQPVRVGAPQLLLFRDIRDLSQIILTVHVTIAKTSFPLLLEVPNQDGSGLCHLLLATVDACQGALHELRYSESWRHLL